MYIRRYITKRPPPSHERLAIGALDEWYASWSLRHCRRTLGRRGAGVGALYVIRNVIWGWGEGGGDPRCRERFEKQKEGPGDSSASGNVARSTVWVGLVTGPQLPRIAKRRDEDSGEGRVATGLASPRVN